MTSVVLSPAQCVKLKTPHILGASAVSIPNTGNTSENTLATIAIPAASLGPNGFLKAWILFSYVSSGNNKTMRAKLGGTTVLQQIRTTSLGDQDLILLFNRNAQNSQAMMPLGAVGYGGGNAAALTAAIDTSLAQNFTITAQLATAGDLMTLEAYQVEVFYGA